MERNEKKIKNVIMILAMLLVVLVGVFLFLSTKNQNMNSLYFDIVIGGFLFLFWLLLDVIEPKLLGQFEGIRKEQKEAYFKYVALDLAGYIGIAVFVFSIGDSNNSFGLIGAIVYIFTVNTKKGFRRKFLEDPQEVREEVQQEEVQQEEIQQEEIQQEEIQQEEVQQDKVQQEKEKQEVMQQEEK